MGKKDKKSKKAKAPCKLSGHPIRIATHKNGMIVMECCMHEPDDVGMPRMDTESKNAWVVWPIDKTLDLAIAMLQNYRDEKQPPQPSIMNMLSSLLGVDLGPDHPEQAEDRPDPSPTGYDPSELN